MRVQSLRTLIFVISLGLLGVSCNDSSTGVDGSGSAVFQGKVENTSSPKSTGESSSSVEGAVVAAAQIKADGSLETIGNSQAQTNAEGQFTLEVDVSAAAQSGRQIVIVADNNGETAKTFVSAQVENGNTITVQPITFESSSEAEVYQDVIANGDAQTVTKADVELYVDNDVAADIENNAENAADIAAALAASAEARARFYSAKGVEYSSEQQEQIMEIKHEAQVALASQLYAAGSQAERRAAMDAFLQAVAAAELEAGVEAWAVAQSSDLAARVLLRQSAAFSSDARAEIRQPAYYYMSVALDAAVRAQAEALGASEATLEALAGAGATLRGELRSATNTSADAVDALFVQYNESVQAAVNNDASLNGSAFVNTNTAISGSSGLKSTLATTLSATGNVDTMLSAYANFSSGIRSIVESNFSQAAESEVEAYTRMLVLINLAS